MRPSRKYEAHSRLQQGFGGKGREVQKARAADEIDDTNGYDPPHHERSHSFIIGCRALMRNFFISSVHSSQNKVNIQTFKYSVSGHSFYGTGFHSSLFCPLYVCVCLNIYTDGWTDSLKLTAKTFAMI